MSHLRFYIVLNLLIFLIFASCKGLCGTTTFSISGKIDSDLNFLLLYKFENLFNRKLVAKIPIVDDSFYYSMDLAEVDTYQIQNPITNQFFMFVWDGNIIIRINSKEMYLSKVYNSPLTNEMNVFDSIRLAKFIKPIWKMDTLLMKLESANDSRKKAFKSMRDSVFAACEIAYKNYGILYIKNHPDSFVSFLQITYTGSFFISNEDRLLIDSLSDKLKKHSRYRKFLGG